MFDSTESVPSPTPAPPDPLLQTLLEVALTGFIFFRPVYAAGGEVPVDFAYEYLNSAAQRMLRLPQAPTGSLLTLYPMGAETDVLAFYREAFGAGQLAHSEVSYQHDGLDGYFHLAAQRQGERLVVSFTDTNDQPHSAVEQAQRQRQTGEQAARQEAERVRADLARAFEQAPVAFALFRGPELVVDFANPEVGLMLGRPVEEILGRPVFEAVPDMRGQGLEELMGSTFAEGTLHDLLEVPVRFERAGRPRQGYFNITYRPQHDAQGNRVGVVCVGVEITDQVRARQQEEQLSAALDAARAETEHQRQRLQAIVDQAPVAIGYFEGPDLLVTAANTMLSTMWGRQQAEVVGKPLLEGVPELRGQGFEDLMQQVRDTGVPFAGTEAPAEMLRAGRLQTTYYNFVYQPLYDAHGAVQGVIDVAVEVTEQVQARQALEEKERQTAVLNEQLQANNAELERTQQQLRHLNEELEGRVAERTRQLAEQQGLLSQILGQVPAYIFTASGPAHRFSFFNPPFQQLMNQRAALGKPLAECLPELVEQGFGAVLDRAYASGQPFTATEAAVLLNQAADSPQQLYFDFTCQPLFDGQGQVQGILGFAVNVTEQAQARRQADTLQAAMLAVAQRQAQQRQEMFQILEQALVAIVLLREPDHRIDYFNPAFEALLPPAEWTGGPLQGHVIDEVYPRIRGAGLLALLDGVFTTGESQTVLDMPLAELQLDSPRYVTFTYQAYREQGQIAGVAVFVYDTTEQVLARQQVQQLNEQLAASNQSLTTTNAELHASNGRLTRTNAELDIFVYSASHDLKAPITNIEGLLLALREQLPPEALGAKLVPRLLGMMDGAVQRFQQTLGHLTDVSRLQQQAQANQAAEAVELAALVEAVRLDILPELTAAGATLTVDVAACPVLYFSAKNLRSILYNLLSNAVKYRAPDRPPLVQLRARCPADGLVELTVQDNGLGLSETQQEQLFRLFRRLHSHVSGSGVGLYMVKKIVDNSGGNLTVQSQLEVGSTFTVTLPTLHPPQP